VKYDSVYISPHIDDAVFSCGGSMANRIAHGERVLVASLFTRGQDRRVEEERRVSELAGYDASLLNFRDAPQRSLRYRVDVHAKPTNRDDKVCAALVDALRELLNSFEYDRCYVPLAVGGHVDHFLACRACKEVVPLGKRIYYEEMPYCLVSQQVNARLDQIGCGIETRHSLGRGWLEMYKHVMGRPRYGGSVYRRLAWALPAMGAVLYHVLNLRNMENGSAEMEGLVSLLENVSETFETRLALSKCYDSQWRIFFRNDDHYRDLSKRYMESLSKSSGAFLERYWLPRDDESGGCG
jgi:hypothetical protein